MNKLFLLTTIAFGLIVGCSNKRNDPLSKKNVPKKEWMDKILSNTLTLEEKDYIMYQKPLGELPFPEKKKIILDLTEKFGGEVDADYTEAQRDSIFKEIDIYVFIDYMWLYENKDSCEFKTVNNANLMMKTNEQLTTDTKRVVEAFYSKTASGDTDGIVGLMAENVVWNIPGDAKLAPWGGRKDGKNGVREFYSLLNEHTQNLVFRVDKVFVDGNQAVAVGYLSTRMLKTNRVFDSHFMAHFTIQDNSITNYLFSEDSNGLVKALK